MGASAAAPANGVVLITIDTLRADRVGAYGWRAARTPAIDALAARGVRADRAYATAPITLVSHASLLTGLNPPRHGARHNGLRLLPSVPTLAELLRARGFATGAFVAAFPLDRRFGLDRGFDTYGDTLPRGEDGKPRNERPGRAVMDEALAWLGGQAEGKPFFLWVHLFEPHAPYEADDAARPASGAPGVTAPGGGGEAGRAAGQSAVRAGAGAPRSVSLRYDDEVARADTQVARLLQALQPRAASTLVILAADHGEAFGEHGEVGHSVFVYDTTLRVPLVLAGPGIAGADARASNGASGGAGRVLTEPVSLVDVMPTVLDLLRLPAAADSDGVSLRPLLAGGGTLGPRTLYAESFAPLLDFGWSPLRALRKGDEKYIAAPRPELYDVARDPAESRNLLAERPDAAGALAAQIERISPADLPPASTASSGASNTSPSSATRSAPSAADRETEARLRSLGYLASSSSSPASPAGGASLRGTSSSASAAARVDPKDRVALASRIAEVTSGELQGAALRRALERLVTEDPRNGQMQMRLGVVLQEAGDCRAAVPHFRAAIAAAVPSADPGLGLAECLAAAGQHDAARAALTAADVVEPGNPIVSANLGMLALEEGRTDEAIARLRAAITRAPDLHPVRFALARAYGRAGQRADAAREARELLARLPSDAPQRAEVQRLLAAVQ